MEVAEVPQEIVKKATSDTGTRLVTPSEREKVRGILEETKSRKERLLYEKLAAEEPLPEEGSVQRIEAWRTWPWWERAIFRVERALGLK